MKAFQLIIIGRKIETSELKIGWNFPNKGRKLKRWARAKFEMRNKARGSLCGCKHKHKHAQLFSENTAEHVGVFGFTTKTVEAAENGPFACFGDINLVPDIVKKL